MKKLLGISLVLLTITGCSLFNSNKENSEDTTTQAVDYSNFIKVGANLLDTVDKTVSLNGVDHKLTFVYSDVVDATYKECASYYVTLLFDGRIVSSELFSQAIEDACYNVEKNKEYTEDYTLYNESSDKKEYLLDADSVKIVKDINNKDVLVLVLTISTPIGDYHKVNYISSNGKFIDYLPTIGSWGINDIDDNDSVVDTSIKIETNSTTYFTCSDAKASEYKVTIENDTLLKTLIRTYSENNGYSIAGGC